MSVELDIKVTGGSLASLTAEQDDPQVELRLNELTTGYGNLCE